MKYINRALAKANMDLNIEDINKIASAISHLGYKVTRKWLIFFGIEEVKWTWSPFKFWQPIRSIYKFLTINWNTTFWELTKYLEIMFQEHRYVSAYICHKCKTVYVTQFPVDLRYRCKICGGPTKIDTAHVKTSLFHLNFHLLI